MNASDLSKQEVARRGQNIYDAQLRSFVESEATVGQVIVIDIKTGDYEINANHLAAVDRARARMADPILYATRIGWPALGRLSGFATPSPSIRHTTC